MREGAATDTNLAQGKFISSLFKTMLIDPIITVDLMQEAILRTTSLQRRNMQRDMRGKSGQVQS